MEGYMTKPDTRHVPFEIGIINTDPNCPASKQAYTVINAGVPFPASGRVVTKVFDAVDNVTTLNVAEIDRARKEYSIFDTVTVSARKLKKDEPLEVYAEYKDVSTITLKIYSGKSGKGLGVFNIKIKRPEYKTPEPKPVSKSATNAPVPQRTAANGRDTRSSSNTYDPDKYKFILDEATRYNEQREKERIENEKKRKQRELERIEQAKREKVERYENAKKELNSLVGLESVKESIKMLVKRLEYENMRNATLGESATPIECPRFIFNGNPGTGKTTVARLVADICYGCGLLSKGNLVEVSRADLVGEYVGQTGKNTKEACDKANGGVLFVDEAYALVQKNENDFGKEAIAVLIKEMEDHRNDMVVIIAGYTEEMDELLKTNSGIKSRITDTITFEDYTTDELFQIADNMAGKKNYDLTEDGKKAFEYLINAKKVDRKFGNAREVRNILDKAISRKAMLFSEGAQESLTELTSMDFGVDLSKNVETSSRELLEQLDRMVGLANVKKNVRQVVSKAKYMIQEVNDSNMGADQLALNMNLCFTGNPGTGKTTVARLYAKLLHSIGLAKTDKVYELTRGDLVAPYMGQTAIKSKEVCEKCYGGVMFIDEAYSLVQGPNDTFGMEALDTLIKEMEDHRDKLVVILAGYTKEMREFMEHNSGLRSRISRFIEFEDYSLEELYSIFKILVREKGCTIDEDASLNAKAFIMDMLANKDNTFGNAREVRKLFEEIFMNTITRVEDYELTGAERKHIINEDVINIEI